MAPHAAGFARAATSSVLSLVIAALPLRLAARESQVTRDFAIPLTLIEEHAGFHTSLEQATRIPGPLGNAARDLLARWVATSCMA